MTGIGRDGALLLDAWRSALSPDDPSRNYILHGVRYGFRITNSVYTGKPEHLDNYKSATAGINAQLVETQILEELWNGRYVITHSKPTLISALGALPKPTPGKVRLIHDCSRPTHASLNDFALPEKFHFQTVQHAVKHVTPNCFMAKVDLSSAYRSVKIHPEDYHLAGLSWTFEGDTEPTWLYDTRLMFGARMAPAIFNCLSSAVCRIMNARGLQRIVCFLDDFLLLADSYNECMYWLQQLMALLRALGFAINYHKVVTPATCVEFLGVEMDSVTGTLRLSALKLGKLLSEIDHALERRALSKRQLQSLAGKLSWACQVVPGGRPHLRRLLTRMNTLRHPYHRTRITSDMRLDFAWWKCFASHFNGTLPMLDGRPSDPVCIDACNTGGGAFYRGDFFHIPWSTWPGVSELHINFKEVLTMEPAALRWGKHWANKRIMVYCDSQAAVGILNKGTCKQPLVMASLRRLFWLSAMYNFKLHALYYPGHRNILADAASRLPLPGARDRLYSALAHTWIL